MEKWIDKDEWDLEIAWRNWREQTFHLAHDDPRAMRGEAYEEYKEILDRIASKNEEL